MHGTGSSRTYSMLLLHGEHSHVFSWCWRLLLAGQLPQEGSGRRATRACALTPSSANRTLLYRTSLAHRSGCPTQPSSPLASKPHGMPLMPR